MQFNLRRTKDFDQGLANKDNQISNIHRTIEDLDRNLMAKLAANELHIVALTREIQTANAAVRIVNIHDYQKADKNELAVLQEKQNQLAKLLEE